MSRRGKSLTRARVNALLIAAGRGLDDMSAEIDGDTPNLEFEIFQTKVLEAYQILRERYPETRLVSD